MRSPSPFRSSQRLVRRVLSWTAPTQLGLAAVALVLLVMAAWGVHMLAVDGDPAEPNLEQVPDEELYVDTDTDGLPDILENYVYGSDPNATRTVTDVVPDGWLARYGYDPTEPGIEQRWAAYPGPGAAPPSWGVDGLAPEFRMTLKQVYLWNRSTDWDENVSGPWNNGLDPRDWMAPSGLPYSWLIGHGLDPNDPDVGERTLLPRPTGDGLSVAESYETATNPRKRDTDGDGLSDDVELDRTGTDPSRFDTAGAGVADGWVVRFGLDARSSTMPNEDPDADGLTNAEEFAYAVAEYGLPAVLNGTGPDPTRRSTAGGPIPDGWLAREGLDVLDPTVAGRRLQCASDYGPTPADGLGDVCLTILDAYRYELPVSWNEARDGPWLGGLRARTNDTDSDGLPDAVELRGWIVNLTTETGVNAQGSDVRVASDPLSPDTDLDGLTDLEELRGRTVAHAVKIDFPATDPSNPDTDFDGLTDGRETIEVPRVLLEELGRPLRLDPVARDTDGDGLEDGAEWSILRTRARQCAVGGIEYGYTNPVRDVRAVLHRIAEEVGIDVDPSPAAVCRLLEPWGDPDGDGNPNILDEDADNDGLLDSWEATPVAYDRSPFASEHERSPTDPINPDSDGDRLPDGWEVRYGQWDTAVGNWNLDPAAWSSFGDDTSDADRDLDDDGTTWYSFHESPAGVERKEHVFVATNLVEYLNETDPNLASTVDNGIRDGWSIFWGRTYPGLDLSEVGDVYPGAPGPLVIDATLAKPSPASDVNPVIDTARLPRFDTDPTPRAGETLKQVHQGVRTTDGVATIYQFERTFEFSFINAQDAGTNPYVRDTDGDGAPDAWESALAKPAPGLPDPVRWQAGQDDDRDGLPLEDEATFGTDPRVADTDLGGVGDGDEVTAQRSPVDPSDDSSVNDPTADLDCDGVTDVDEIEGWTHPTLGEITTDPGRPDSDGDGLLDGFDRTFQPADGDEPACLAELRATNVLELVAQDGRIRFPGDASNAGDPRRLSTAMDGIPDGWRVLHGLDATSDQAALDEAYEFGRPAWWDEATMGPWLWGQSPIAGADVDGDGDADSLQTSTGLRFVDADLDADGLNDLSGEDPTPGARPELIPPAGRPDVSGLSLDEIQSRGQAFGVPPSERGLAGSRDGDGDGVPDAFDRVPVDVFDLIVHGADAEQGVPRILTEKAYRLTGSVLAQGSDGPVAVPNATVIVEFRNHATPVGAGFTSSNGTFDVSFNVTKRHTVRVPDGLVLMGQVGGSVEWPIDVDGIPVGPGTPSAPNVVRVWVYNTTGAAQVGDPTYIDVPARLRSAGGRSIDATAQGIVGTTSEPIPVILASQGVLDVTAPTQVAAGEDVSIGVTLRDHTGRPITDAPVTINVFGDDRTLVTDDVGAASVALVVPEGPPRDAMISVAYPGEGHVHGTTKTMNIRVKSATDLDIAAIEPTPALAGRTLTIHGAVVSRGEGVAGPVGLQLGRLETRTNSTDDGRFALEVDIPSDMPPGEVQARVTYPGTPDHMPSQAIVPVRILVAPRLSLVIATDTIQPGETTTVSATLGGLEGPVMGAELSFDGWPGPGPADGTTDASGTVTRQWTAPELLGSHRVGVVYPGSDRWLPARAEAWLNVSVPSLLQLDPPATVTRDSIARLSGRLVSATGGGIGAEVLSVRFNGAEVDRPVTLANGTFTAEWSVPADAPLGPADIKAVFNGSVDGRHHPTTQSVRTNVLQGLRISPFNVDLRRGTTVLSLQVTLDDGTRAPPGEMTLDIPGIEYTATGQLVRDGVTFRIPVPANTVLDRLDAVYSFQPEIDIPVIRVRAPFHVVSPAEIALIAPQKVQRGEDLVVSGRVSDDQGHALDDVPVRLGFAGVETTVPTSNGTFTARIVVPADLPEGPETLFASTRPARPLISDHLNTTIEVRRGVVLDVELQDSAAPNEVVRGTIRIHDDADQPVQGRRLLVQTSDGTSYYVSTDDAGEAIILVRQGGGNGTRFSIHYPGDERYGAASATATVSVAAPGSDGTSSVVAAASIAAFVILAAVAYMFHRQRRAALDAAVGAIDEGRRRLLDGSPYRVTILKTYYALLDLIAEHDVHARDQETLREYQDRVERLLGLKGHAFDTLFGIFEQVFYGAEEPGPSKRRAAVAAFEAAAQDLRARGASNASDSTDEGVVS